MRIEYIGHASFLITVSSGVKILFDPYESGAFGGQIQYLPIIEAPDIVIISHQHQDHSYTNKLQGDFKIIDKAGKTKIKDIQIEGFLTYHDSYKGTQRGENIIFKVIAEGISLLHLGDLGCELEEGQIERLGKIDVLFLPVGGVFTIDYKIASSLMRKINPSITIPMHFKTPKVKFPLAPVENFLKDKQNVEIKKESTLQITFSELTKPKIVLLSPSH